LKRTDIPATVIEVDEITLGEYEENAARLNLCPSEAVAIAREVRPVEKKAAKERQALQGSINLGVAKGGNLPPSGKGKNRDKVAAYVGISGRTLEKAEAVVKAAEEDPKKYGAFAETMDNTGKVDLAYSKVQKQRLEDNLPEAPKFPSSKYKTIVVDPPWGMDKSERTARPLQGSALDYRTISLCPKDAGLGA
jgi:hypothetical protein